MTGINYSKEIIILKTMIYPRSSIADTGINTVDSTYSILVIVKKAMVMIPPTNIIIGIVYFAENSGLLVK